MVLGSRSKGLGKVVQELWARFKVARFKVPFKHATYIANYIIYNSMKEVVEFDSLIPLCGRCHSP